MINRSLNDAPLIPVSHEPSISKRVLLEKDEVPHINMLSNIRLKPNQSIMSHQHDDMHEVFIVESGYGFIRHGIAEFPLRPGKCIVMHPGEEHEIRCIGTSDLVITYFGVQ